MASQGLRMPQEKPEGEQVRYLAGLGGMSVEEFLEQAAQTTYPFYAILLPSPGESQVNTFVRTSWNLLHAMSGHACLLLTALAPEHPTAEMKQFLFDLVGEEKARKALAHYRHQPERVESDTYKLAQEIRIDYDRLPCLVLMTDLQSRQQLLQRLPNWDAEDLRRFFETLFTRINHHKGEHDPRQRLEGLKNELGRNFMLGLQTARAARGIREGLAEIKWSEVIESALTNNELMARAFKLVLAMFGAG